ncbi:MULTISPECIES: hypothetical protein [Spirulina sp. CCY15215]|nr:hypothetical protein [Spirulina major]
MARDRERKLKEWEKDAISRSRIDRTGNRLPDYKRPERKYCFVWEGEKT